ncbi:hypothetical protein O6H91_23G069900 [Diphasiastrum complanatum]|uniref:Uncharacterized protein n=1 Tax=Diphasiastrum complanatum TaxID=34168 RepID=A0ACC2AC05_DIPCM|nr:hypothetical protein O6H91_23G069900 [Diphasiastrum complanatum]
MIHRTMASEERSENRYIKCGSAKRDPRIITSANADPMTQLRMGKVSHSERECCMCGDVGFLHELFKCKSCGRRYQHRYCSKLYPQNNKYVCDWCLSDVKQCLQQSDTQSNQSKKKSILKLREDHSGFKDEHWMRNQKFLSKYPLDIDKYNKGALVSKNAERIHLKKLKCNIREGETSKSALTPSTREGASRGHVRRYKLLADVLML